MGENHFCFPPVKRAVDAVYHLEKFKVKGILIIPVWPRSQIFPFFFPDGTHAAEWVETLNFINPCFESSKSVGACFKGYQQFKTLALTFNFQKRASFFTPSVDRLKCIQSGCDLCV